MIPTKVECRKCKRKLPFTDRHFHLETYNNSNGKRLSKICKACVKGKRSSPEYVARVAAWNKQWHAADPNRKRRYLANARIKSWANLIIQNSRSTAKGRNIPHELTSQMVLDLYEKQKRKCFWLGIPIRPSAAFRDPRRPSADLLDKNKGYVSGNVVLCCMAANMGRSSLSPDEFRKFVDILKAIYGLAGAEASPTTLAKFKRIAAEAELYPQVEEPPPRREPKLRLDAITEEEVLGALSTEPQTLNQIRRRVATARGIKLRASGKSVAAIMMNLYSRFIVRRIDARAANNKPYKMWQLTGIGVKHLKGAK